MADRFPDPRLRRGAAALDFAITGDTGFFQPSAPVTSQDIIGGLSPAENSLFLFVNYATSSNSITVTMDIG